MFAVGAQVTQLGAARDGEATRRKALISVLEGPIGYRVGALPELRVPLLCYPAPKAANRPLSIARERPLMHNRERRLQFRQSVMKFELYIISLWLLFVLMIVVKVDFPICFGADCRFIGTWQLISTNVLPFISLVLIVVVAICYLRFRYRIQSNVGLPIIAKKVEDLSYEHLTFLTTYIVPLICFNLDNVRYIIALFTLLIVIGQIYVKTDKFYANPTLAILGFRLYKLEIDGVSKVLITTQRITESDKIVFTSIDEKFVSGRKA